MFVICYEFSMVIEHWGRPISNLEVGNIWPSSVAGSLLIAIQFESVSGFLFSPLYLLYNDTILIDKGE